jgi:hypothetical protein
MKLITRIYVIGLLATFACSPQEDEIKVAEPTARIVYINSSPTLARNVEVYTSNTVVYGGNNIKGNLNFGGMAALNPTVSNATLRLRLERAATDLINRDLELESYGYYSALVANADPTVIDTAAAVGVIFSQDDMTLPSSGNARMRFINLALGSPAVDLYIYRSGGKPEAPAFVNKSYLQASSSDASIALSANEVTDFGLWGFQEIPVAVGAAGLPAPIEYVFELRNAGEAVTVPAKLSTKINITTGRFYTIMVRGVQNAAVGSPSALSIRAVEYPYPNY